MPILEIAVAAGVLYGGTQAMRKQKQEKRRMQHVLNGNEATSLTGQAATVWRQMAWKMQHFTNASVDRIWGRERNQQLQEMGASNPDANETLHQDDIAFAISVGCLGLTIVGRVVYPPLALLSALGLLYLLVPVVKDGIEKLVQERTFKSYLIDAIVLPGAILAGFIFASALGAVLFFASRVLLIRSEIRARRSVTNVFGQQTESVWVIVDGVEAEVPFGQVQRGDVVVIQAGQMIPVDGVIQDGMGLVDQRMLTGESQPNEKKPGDEVLAATILLSGRLCIEVQKTGKDTVAAKIGDILANTADFQVAIVSRGEAVADRVVPLTLLLSALAWPLLGVEAALAVMMSYVGYNMRITAPMSMLNFLDITSHNGILIKDARSLDMLKKIDTIVFDKTGTLTLDQPQLGCIHCFNGASEDEILTYAASAEARQSHPIARAIVQAAQSRNLPILPIEDGRYDLGLGIKVHLADREVRVGSSRFFTQEQIALPADLPRIESEAQLRGHSLVLVAFDDQLVGAVELKPAPRPEALKVINALRARKLELYIISGDQEEPTRSLADSLGIDHYFANTLPDHKAQLVEQLQAEGRTVCFVGDGINDAIALQQADVSISLRGASTVATDTAQVILMDGDFRQLTHLLDIVDDFDANMRVNLISSLVPGIICIGGVFFLHWGLVTAIMIYNVGLITGIGNAMRPLLRKNASHQPGLPSQALNLLKTELPPLSH